MPQSLSPIPLEMPITDDGKPINTFFRLRWQQLIDSFTKTPTVAAVEKLAQNAAIATVAAFTTRAAGLYKVSYYMRKTTADGVSSSLTVTFGWTETGVPLTESGAALTTDTTAANQSGSKLIWSDGSADITYAVAYASNTPGAMRYRIDVVVELMA